MVPDSPPSQVHQPGDDESYAPPDDLRPAITTALKWKFLSQAIREGTRLALGIVLARLLTPDDWGLASLALIVAALVQMLPEAGLGYALVQRRALTERDRSTVFWLSTGVGAVTTGVAVAISGVVAGVFDEPELQPLFAVASLGIAISATGSVPLSLLTRDLAYRKIELRQIVGTVSGAAVAIPLAVSGAGPWAIIANSLTATISSTALVWLVTPWRPRLEFSRSSARTLGGFGTTVFASQLMAYGQFNVDKLLVGRFLGPAALGTYAFAYNLMFMPIMNISYPLQGVLFPALASIQGDDKRLRATWLRGKRLAVAVLAPAFLLVVVVAPDMVPLVFGDTWNEAIPVLQLLCVAGVAYSFSTLNWNLLLVRNRPRSLLQLTLLITLVVLLSVVVGLEWGVVGVAACYAGGHWLLVLPETWLTTRAGGIGFVATLRAAAAALPFAAAAALVGFGVRLVLLEVGAPPAVRLVAATATVLVAYAGLVRVGSRSLWDEAWEVAGLRGRRS